MSLANVREIPIVKLQAAAADLGVTTWGGTTKIAGFKKLPTPRPNDLFRVKVTYEARHKHLWCQSAQWPVEWNANVIDETKVAPDRIYVDTHRVPGGDGNGAYIKQMSARIELLRHSANKTSLQMRTRPGAFAGALVARRGDHRIRRSSQEVAFGGNPPGAAADPACPY
jgi:hypothetical protein